MKKYIISGLVNKCESTCLHTDDQRPHQYEKSINENGEEEGEGGGEGDEDEDEEEDEQDKIIPMLCYGLILLVLTTLLAGSFITVLFAKNQEFANMTKKIFVAILLGEMFGVLLSILCVIMYCACDASAANYLYKQICNFRYTRAREAEEKEKEKEKEIDFGGGGGRVKENANKLKIV
jgi:hypothetical protein